MGSGWALARQDTNKPLYVITASHVVGGSRTAQVVFAGHQPRRAAVLASEYRSDVAVLVCKTNPPPVVGLPLASQPPARGELVTASGYGGSGRARRMTGLIYSTGLNYGAWQGWQGRSAAPRSGDSGGPVWSKLGAVGLVSTSDFGSQGHGPALRTITNVLQKVGYFRQQGQCPLGGCQPQQPAPEVQPPIQTIPQAPQVVPPSQPPVCPPCPKCQPPSELIRIQPVPGPEGPKGDPGEDGRDGKDVDMDQLRAIIESIVKRIQPEDGRDGADGEDGEDGKDGRPGRDADPEMIRRIVEQVLSRYEPSIDLDALTDRVKDKLPGIGIEIRDEDGNIRYDEERKLGEKFSFKLELSESIVPR